MGNGTRASIEPKDPNVKAQRALLSIAAAVVAATLAADAARAEESGTVLSPQALQEIAQVEAEIDRIEAQTIARLAVPPDNQVQQIELLGKLMLYDKELSVNRNEACAFCHMPEAGFTGRAAGSASAAALVARFDKSQHRRQGGAESTFLNLSREPARVADGGLSMIRKMSLVRNSPRCASWQRRTREQIAGWRRRQGARRTAVSHLRERADAVVG